MGVVVWATRCIPAFSIFIVTALCIYAFVVEPYGLLKNGAHNGNATWPQVVLSIYTVILHIFALMFPLRVCWAVYDILSKMKKMASTAPHQRRRRVTSIKGDESLPPSPVPLFAIILPAYKEEMETLEETLQVLASHPQATYSYDVYLAMEEKEEKVTCKAEQLIKIFDFSFRRMSYTVHPMGIPGEAQGKSSNESWAAKEASKNYQYEDVKKNVIFTTMDADTHLSTNYFRQIANMHTEHFQTSATTIYTPPIVFDRNLHHVPLPVRTADMLWCGAGLSSLYDGSPVCIPTSVYSLPLTLVEQVGGWDTDPGAIGEDLHMYLKCFFAMSGNLTVRIVYSAASQYNVSSDVKGIRGYFDGLSARYQQAMRHMWGSLDTGFAVRETCKMVQRHRRADHAKVDLRLSAPNANWTAFYTSTGLHRSLSPKVSDVSPVAPPQSINKRNLLTVYHRLFEAHFLPTHLFMILAASGVNDLFHPSFLVPPVLKVALNISGWLRLGGFCTMLLFFTLYEKYHRLCVGLRQEEMRRAGMLEGLSERDGFTLNVFPIGGLAEAALFPLGGFIFGALPALQAMLSHLFTDRLTYVVSLKPQFNISRRYSVRNGQTTP